MDLSNKEAELIPLIPSIKFWSFHDTLVPANSVLKATIHNCCLPAAKVPAIAWSGLLTLAPYLIFPPDASAEVNLGLRLTPCASCLLLQSASVTWKNSVAQ
jgi:hypothetical protein